MMIAYDDGKSVNINLSKERIVIDGYAYNTELYHSDQSEDIADELRKS
ncbi:MAG: hypothetical protein Q4A78_10615 [Peptostreptococcaceae bacterium]|nr:hypothetical protein [Peptostreptococcaceae bacterium]